MLMISGTSGGGYQAPMNNINPLNNVNANMFQVYNYTQQQQPYNPYQNQNPYGSQGNKPPTQPWGSHGNVPLYNNTNSYGNQPYIPPQINSSPWGDTSLNNGWGNFNPAGLNQNPTYNQSANNNVNPLTILGGVLNT